MWYFLRNNNKIPIFEKNNINLEDAQQTRWRNKNKSSIDDIRTYTKNQEVKNITNDEYKNLIPSYSLYLKHTEDLYVVDVDVYGINSMDDFVEQTGITMFKKYSVDYW